MVRNPGPLSKQLLNIFSTGKIYSVPFPSQLVVVINSLDDAADVLSNRSGIYPDRPPLIFRGDLCGSSIVLLGWPRMGLNSKGTD